LGFLYAALLLCISVVPGIPARLSIVGGAMLTFLYTQHLKPITWVKTITCALLIALAPVTSGTAALSLDQITAVMSGSNNNNNMLHELLLGDRAVSLGRLVGMLFFGFLGREILMDINDVVDDRLHKIKTVPVRYGRQFASRVAFLSTLLMAGLCLLNATTAPTTAAATSIGAIRNPRALAFAVLGSLAQLRRAYQVLRTDGTSRDLVSQAVEEGKITVLLLLASFV
jgi:4-hydroxybenzoate polyprenyltransferase